MKLTKTLATLLLVMLLTSGVFAVSNTDAIVVSDKTTPSLAERSNFTEISSSDINSVNKVSIGLDPRKQTSANSEATYKVIVKALYLPETDSLQTSEYELKFESEDEGLRGELDAESLTLQPGEKKTFELRITAESSGEHKFTVAIEDKDGNEVKAEGSLSVLDSNTEPSQRIKLDLQPEKQYTESGSSEYILTVHRPTETPCYSNARCASSYSAQEYKLVFVSEQESLSSELQSSLSLRPGEKASVPLKITAREKGTYVFKVYAEASDYETSVRGLLVYGKEPQTQSINQVSSSSLLDGEGFAINEDQSEGVLVYLNLLSSEEIRGKMVFGEDSYALKGQVSDSGTQIDFSIFNPEDLGYGQSIGEFSGEIKKFDNFVTLHGGLDFEIYSYPNQYWTLTIIGKQDSIFKNEIIVAQPDAPITKTINTQEVVTIRQGQIPESEDVEETTTEAYMVPEKIERKKIFGFIPNPWGDKLLKVKLVEGDAITEKTLEEFSTAQIGDYEVGIGSLENEDAIEVSITKTTNIKLN